MSMELGVKALNRGAALCSKPNTESIDFFIPVMLAQPGTETAFGPMFDEWTPAEIDEGCQHVSGIFINTKNFHDDKDHETAAANIALKTENFEDKWTFDSKKNVYLSILQEFGPSSKKYNNVKGEVKILPRKYGNREYQQIVVMLKGHGGDTYKCLADLHQLPFDDPKFQNRRLTQEAFRQLKERVEFGDMEGDETDKRYVTIKEGFYTLGNTKEKARSEWKVMKESIEQTKKQYLEMSNVAVVNQRDTVLRKLDEVVEQEDDSMDID